MGKIITFYSYKGGVGRSMMLANVAVLMCEWGYKALIVDWDLEAPGLERFFEEQLKKSKQNYKSKQGVIELLGSKKNNNKPLDWSDLTIKIPLDKKGELDLITAGMRDNEYYKRVGELDVNSFYESYEGGFWLEELREEWKRNYDFILIDSRTGVTDSGGICTIQMPDMLVMVLTATNQSLEGVIDIANNINTARNELPIQRPSVPIFPIPSRFDTNTEFKISQNWLDKFTNGLEIYYKKWFPYEIIKEKKVRDFIELIKVPYVPYFSFGEKLPVIEQGTLDPNSIGYAYESIAAILVNELGNIDLFLESRDEFIKGVTHREIDYASFKNKGFKVYRIFLSINFKHQDEKNRIELFIHRKNKELVNKNVFLQINFWEEAEINNSRNQTLYNKTFIEEIQNCDIYILLINEKIGKYTSEEFEIAFNHFKEKGSPKIFLLKSIDEEFKNVLNPKVYFEFNDKLIQNNVFPFEYDNFSKAELYLDRIFNQLFDAILLKSYGQPATLLSPNGVTAPSVFFGRESELKEIRKRLDKIGKLMLINAEGGIGKTTLAAKYWQESLYDYKYNAWLFCENGIMNALKELAPKLDIDLAGMDETKQLNALKHALSEVHDDFLLVLDNANDDEDIRCFKQTFEGFHWHVLITSRCQGVLDKDQELPITHLPPPLAKALFERFYKEENQAFEALLDRLLKAIGYHTLLIEIFAKNMHESAELGIKMADFLQKLEKEGLHLGKYSFEIKTDYNIAVKTNAATTDEILNTLYDFGELTEEQRLLLVNLSFLPIESYTMAFINSLLANDNNRSDLDLFRTLKTLCKKGWIAQTENTYRLSPIVQDLLLYKNKQTLGVDSQDLLKSLTHIFGNDTYNLLNISLTAAEPYSKLIYQINKSLEAQPNEAIANLNFGIGLYFDNIGDLVGTKYAYKHHQKIYQKLLANDPENLSSKNGLAISYGKLGNIYEQTGDWKNALLNYQEYYRISKEIYENSPKNLIFKNSFAISYSKLGWIYEQTGDYKNALLNYQEYYHISKEIYESSPENLSYKNSLAISYSKLGGIYEQIGDWKNALLNYQEYYHISKEIYESSPENLSYKDSLAISYSKLGGVYEQIGDWKNALLNYQMQLRIFKEIYESSPENLFYKNGLAISYSKLGDIFQQTGDLEKALLNYYENHRISKEIYESSPENLSYKNGLAISYSKLGIFYVKNNKISEAVQCFSESRMLLEELWRATQGQIISFTYYFSLTTKYMTDVIKYLIQNNHYPPQQMPSITESIKDMRKEGKDALKIFSEKGLLLDYQKPLFDDLLDESWYNF